MITRTIHVNAEVKLSRRYHSVAISYGITADLEDAENEGEARLALKKRLLRQAYKDADTALDSIIAAEDARQKAYIEQLEQEQAARRRR